MAPVRAVWANVRRPRYGLLDLTIFTAVLAGILVAWFTVKYRQWSAVTFQSPLPEVRAAEEKVTPDSIAYQRPYEFTADWFSWNIPVWEKVLAPLKAKPNVRYLEIGVYEGRSAVWMLENVLTHPTARLTGIDIFDGPYEARYLANLERSGASGKATTIKNRSQVAMRQQPLESFDVVYIDGSHAKNDVLEDAVLCWRLLKKDGILIFDDYRWAGCFTSGTCDRPTDFPKAAIDAFVECFAEQAEVIHNSYQLILKKKA